MKDRLVEDVVEEILLNIEDDESESEISNDEPEVDGDDSTHLLHEVPAGSE